MKSLKHILAMLAMATTIVVAGCNKEENGGGKEKLPHPTSTYKKCPILAHFGNEKLGIKEISINKRDKQYIYTYDKEQRLVKIIDPVWGESNFEYKYDLQGRLVSQKKAVVKDGQLIDESDFVISYDTYGFVNSIIEDSRHNTTFKYSNDTVIMEYYDNKYILKFSDDLHLTYEENVNEKSWKKYIWKDGNMISEYNSECEKKDYQYDNSLNIEKLLCDLLYYIVSNKYYTFNKNNEIKENRQYTYNDKGLLEIIAIKQPDGTVNVWKTFNYIYY